MSTDAKSVPPKRKLTAADVAKIPRVVLLDERHRLWGFFRPEDAAMIKTRTPAEWYALARRLLAQQPLPYGRFVVIPYEENAGRVRGRFVVSPWSDEPVTPPSFTKEEIDEMEAMANDKSRMLTFEEFKESVIETLQARF